MSDSPDTGSELPRHLLEDDVVRLQLIRRLGPGSGELRPPAARFMAHVPEYRFAIHRRSDGERVGRIHVRRTRDETVLRAVGHAGYEVDEGHRRRGYATRAIHRIVEVAHSWDLLPLWVLIEPDNVPSRRAVERAGFELVEEVETSPEALGMGIGPRVCRYASPERVGLGAA